MYYGIKREATVSMEIWKMLRVVFLGSFLFEAKIESLLPDCNSKYLECLKLIPYDLSSFFFYICSNKLI